MKVKKLETEKILSALKMPLISFLAAVAVVFMLLLLISDNPFSALCAFFAVPFSAPYYLGTWLNSAALLVQMQLLQFRRGRADLLERLCGGAGA